MSKKAEVVTSDKEIPVSDGVEDRTQPSDGGKSLMETLFPDFIEEKDEETPKEKKEEQPTVTTPEEPEPVVEGQEDVPTEQPEKDGDEDPKALEEDLDSFVDVNQFKGKKVKLKVDGQEEILTVDDLVRRVQSEKAATLKFQKAAEERRKIAEERQKFLEERQKISGQQNTEYPEPANTNEADIENHPAFKEMRAKLDAITSGTQDILIQNNRQKMKKKFQDFDDVFPLMQRYISELDVTPEADSQIQFFDKTDEGNELLYWKAKQKYGDLLVKPKQEQKKPVSNGARPKPPIVKVDSGSSSGAGGTDDFQVKYNTLLKKAREGNRDAVSELIKMKYSK